MSETATKLYTHKFWLLCVSSFLFFSSFNLIIPELPDYLTKLGGAEHKGLIIPLFTLMAGFSRPFSGRLTDTIGRVPILIYGVVVCIIAGFLYPLVTGVIGFFALRVLHGMSTGFKPTASSAYIADISPVHRRGEAMGIQGLFGSLGMAAVPAIGGWIANLYGFNTMFYASSVCAILSVLVVVWVPETLIKRERFRWGLLKIKLKDILEKRAFPAAIVMLLTSFSFGTILTLVPDFSAYVGIENKGLFFTVFTVSSLLMRVLAGKFSDKYGRVPAMIAGTLLYAVTMVFAGWIQTATGLFIVAFFFGMGMGITSPTIFAWTVDLADDERRGRALSTMFIALEAGIGIGGVFAGYSYGNDPANFPISFALSGFLAFMASVYLFVYHAKQKKFASARG